MIFFHTLDNALLSSPAGTHDLLHRRRRSGPRWRSVLRTVAPRLGSLDFGHLLNVLAAILPSSLDNENRARRTDRRIVGRILLLRSRGNLQVVEIIPIVFIVRNQSRLLVRFEKQNAEIPVRELVGEGAARVDRHVDDVRAEFFCALDRSAFDVGSFRTFSSRLLLSVL